MLGYTHRSPTNRNESTITLKTLSENIQIYGDFLALMLGDGFDPLKSDSNLGFDSAVKSDLV